MQRLPQACLILASLFFILEGIYVKLKPEELRLYAVTDRAWTEGTEGVCRQVEAAVRGGATFVQLREKHLEHDEFLAEARAVVALCRALGVKCVINDDVDIAVESGADGVHVGQEDLEASLARERLGPGKIIGVSAHNAAEARRAEAAGADYIGSGAAFATSTKETAAPIGPEGLRAVVEAWRASDSRASPSSPRSLPRPTSRPLRGSSRSSPGGCNSVKSGALGAPPCAAI